MKTPKCQGGHVLLSRETVSGDSGRAVFNIRLRLKHSLSCMMHFVELFFVCLFLFLDFSLTEGTLFSEYHQVLSLRAVPARTVPAG